MFPCDKEIRKNNYELMSELSEKLTELAELENKVNSVKSQNNFAGIDDSKVEQLINEFRSDAKSFVFN